MTADLTAWILGHAGVSALAFARAAGLAWTAPGLATPGLGFRFRVLLAGLLGLTLAPLVRIGTASSSAVPGWSTLGTVCLGEAMVGAALGWSAALIVAGARQAGELVGAQAGLSAAALLDPEAGDGLTALGHLYGLVALGVFLALDGPLGLVRGLVESYRVIPPGGGELTRGAAALAFGRVGQALALAVRAAAPAALAVALAGVALGLLGRAAPSLQLVALAVPVRSALGLTVVLLGLTALAAVLAASWASWPGPGPAVGLGVGGG
jgi:flagellar biosynthesis protein FliR